MNKPFLFQLQSAITSFFVALLIACIFVSTSCSYFTTPATTNSPVPTSSPTAQAIVAKTIQALAQVSSYNLDTDVVNTYKFIVNSNTATNITEWKGTKLIYIPNREMRMDMKITDTYFGANMDASLEMYFKDGYEFLEF